MAANMSTITLLELNCFHLYDADEKNSGNWGTMIYGSNNKQHYKEYHLLVRTIPLDGASQETVVFQQNLYL
jgi:hypothetical protein